jgi:hypothetical protein
MILRILAQVPDGTTIPKGFSDQASQEGLIQNIILPYVFGTIALVSVLIIVIAGFTYVLSGGDPQKTNRAKDAILYAVIGLVVAILGYTIVAFVANEVVS